MTRSDIPAWHRDDAPSKEGCTEPRLQEGAAWFANHNACAGLRLLGNPTACPPRDQALRHTLLCQ